MLFLFAVGGFALLMISVVIACTVYYYGEYRPRQPGTTSTGEHYT